MPPDTCHDTSGGETGGEHSCAAGVGVESFTLLYDCTQPTDVTTDGCGSRRMRHLMVLAVTVGVQTMRTDAIF
jgi:hypothetical protein